MRAGCFFLGNRVGCELWATSCEFEGGRVFKVLNTDSWNML